MILWHLAGAIFLFRWIFRDPRVDLRLLALGALAPDLLDLLWGWVLGQPTRQSGGHALVVPASIAILILLATNRGGLRRSLMTVLVAWLFHLGLDGVWLREQTFMWPVFGWEFAPWPGGSAWTRAWSDPWRWIKEATGLGYLVLLWRSLPTEGRDHAGGP